MKDNVAALNEFCLPERRCLISLVTPKVKSKKLKIHVHKNLSVDLNLLYSSKIVLSR